MELTRSTLTIDVRGRKVTLHGEAYARGWGSPDFVAYLNTLVHWDDGGSISAAERAEVLRCISEEAENRGLNIEFE